MAFGNPTQQQRLQWSQQANTLRRRGQNPFRAPNSQPTNPFEMTLRDTPGISRGQVNQQALGQSPFAQNLFAQRQAQQQLPQMPQAPAQQFGQMNAGNVPIGQSQGASQMQRFGGQPQNVMMGTSGQAQQPQQVDQGAVTGLQPQPQTGAAPMAQAAPVAAAAPAPVKPPPGIAEITQWDPTNLLKNPQGGAIKVPGGKDFFDTKIHFDQNGNPIGKFSEMNDEQQRAALKNAGVDWTKQIDNYFGPGSLANTLTFFGPGKAIAALRLAAGFAGPQAKQPGGWTKIAGQLQQMGISLQDIKKLETFANAGMLGGGVGQINQGIGTAPTPIMSWGPGQPAPGAGGHPGDGFQLPGLQAPGLTPPGGIPGLPGTGQPTNPQQGTGPWGLNIGELIDEEKTNIAEAQRRADAANATTMNLLSGFMDDPLENQARLATAQLFQDASQGGSAADPLMQLLTQQAQGLAANPPSASSPALDELLGNTIGGANQILGNLGQFAGGRFMPVFDALGQQALGITGNIGQFGQTSVDPLLAQMQGLGGGMLGNINDLAINTTNPLLRAQSQLGMNLAQQIPGMGMGEAQPLVQGLLGAGQGLLQTPQNRAQDIFADLTQGIQQNRSGALQDLRQSAAARGLMTPGNESGRVLQQFGDIERGTANAMSDAARQVALQESMRLGEEQRANLGMAGNLAQLGLGATSQGLQNQFAGLGALGDITGRSLGAQAQQIANLGGLMGIGGDVARTGLGADSQRVQQSLEALRTAGSLGESGLGAESQQLQNMLGAFGGALNVLGQGYGAMNQRAQLPLNIMSGIGNAAQTVAGAESTRSGNQLNQLGMAQNLLGRGQDMTGRLAQFLSQVQYMPAQNPGLGTMLAMQLAGNPSLFQPQQQGGGLPFFGGQGTVKFGAHQNPAEEEMDRIRGSVGSAQQQWEGWKRDEPSTNRNGEWDNWLARGQRLGFKP